MKFKPYAKDLDYSYAPGVFTAMELSLHAPDQWLALLVHPDGMKNDGIRSLIERAENLRVRVEEAPRAIIRVAGKENCYAVGVFEKREKELSSQEDHLVLVSPSDMGNMGTNLRTAAGFGVFNVAIIRPAADPFDPRSVRASMGAIFKVRLSRFDSFAEYSADQQRQRFFFRLQNAGALTRTKRQKSPADFVFGNEASGLPKELLSEETGVFIEQSDAVDSLNLSVAVGIGLHYFRV